MGTTGKAESERTRKREDESRNSEIIMTTRVQFHWQLDVYQLSVEAAMEIYALSILRTVRNCVLCRIKRADSECDRDPAISRSRPLYEGTPIPDRLVPRKSY